MYVFSIAKKEFLQNIRDYKIMFIMTLMPLALIFLMGLAISGAFTQADININDINIEVSIVGENSVLSDSLENMLTGFLSEKQITYVQAKDGIASVKNKDTGAFILIDTQEETIKFYHNNDFATEASIIEVALKNYIRQFNVRTVLEDYQVSMDDSMVKQEFIGSGTNSSAMDYYGVAMSILFVFYGIPLAISSVIKERKKGTMNRILLTPVKKIEVLFGKVLGNIMISMLQITILMGGTILFFNVNWGIVWLAFVMLTTMVISAVALGITLGFLFSSEEKAMGMIHVLIVIFAMFGGSYMPLRDLGFFGQIGKFISPIWWNMNGLLSMIYGESNDLLFQAILVNIATTILLLSFTAFVLKRKEVIYG